MAKSIFIGLDFSMDKPAMTILYDKEFSFVIWPLSMSEKQCSLYNEYGVECFDRKLSSISSKEETSSQLALKHTMRAIDLANLIVNRINQFIYDIGVDIKDTKLYIASEGLSFGSKGNAALNLATYKAILMAKLYENFGTSLTGLYTYPPISIKAIAGCAQKTKVKDKNAMIKEFVKQKVNTKFKEGLLSGQFSTKQGNFIKCVDDIVDSFWVLKTLLKKEGFI